MTKKAKAMHHTHIMKERKNTLFANILIPVSEHRFIETTCVHSSGNKCSQNVKFVLGNC